MARRKRLNPKIVYTRRVSFTGPLLARKLQKVDAVIAVSETIRKILLKTGVSEKMVFVAESGTDFSQFDSAPDRETISSELKIPFDAFVIGNVSYFKPEKGHEQLIRVFCKFGKENSYLLLIGDGPTRGHCEQIARESPCAERILFTGYREDAFRFYSAMDVFFFSSSKGEGWSGVLREAMGARVPVIAVRQDSTEEQVDSGLLVSNDEQQWLDALSRLYQNPALRKELAEAAFVRAKKYTIDSMAAKTEECYYRIAR